MFLLLSLFEWWIYLVSPPENEVTWHFPAVAEAGILVSSYRHYCYLSLTWLTPHFNVIISTLHFTELQLQHKRERKCSRDKSEPEVKSKPRCSLPSSPPSPPAGPARSSTSPSTQGSMSFIGASIQTLNVFCPYPWVLVRLFSQLNVFNVINVFNVLNVLNVFNTVHVLQRVPGQFQWRVSRRLLAIRRWVASEDRTPSQWTIRGSWWPPDPTCWPTVDSRLRLIVSLFVGGSCPSESLYSSGLYRQYSQHQQDHQPPGWSHHSP